MFGCWEGGVATTTWSQQRRRGRGVGVQCGAAALDLYQHEGQVDVLVVDDDHLTRTSVSSVLRSAGFRTDEAEDGFVALERLRSMSVGSVLVDTDLPGLDGMQLLDKLDNPPPVIFMSSLHYGAEFILGKFEAYTLIQKPISSALLLMAVSRALATDHQGRR